MTLSTCPAFAFIPVLFTDIPPVPEMRIHLAGAMALNAHIRVGVAGLAGLQVPPHLRRMIRIPVVDLRRARLPVRFDVHASLLPDPAMAVRTETRLVAAIAVLGVIRRLDGMCGDKIGPMRFGHVLPFAGRASL